MYLLAALFRQIARLRELYEADFHKLGIYGSVRVWANAWDVVSRTPSRGGRGRRAPMGFVVCVLGAAGFRFFLFLFFFFERPRPAASMRPPCLIYFSTSNEGAKRPRPLFAYRAKKPLHTWVRTEL